MWRALRRLLGRFVRREDGSVVVGWLGEMGHGEDRASVEEWGHLDDEHRYAAP